MTSDPIESIPEHLRNWALIRSAGEERIQFLALEENEDELANPFTMQEAFILGNSEGNTRIYQITHRSEYMPREADQAEGPVQSTETNLQWEGPFKRLVSIALRSIEQEKFVKVVPSASWDIKSKTTVEMAFEKLLERNPKATVFLISSEAHGIWLGASPEVLFTKTGNQLYSMALAGTRKSGTATWGQKEQKEQSIVTDHIESILHNLGFEHIERTETTTISTGDLEHICTGIHAISDDNDSWRKLLNELHPTAALMGYPREEALRFVREMEAHDRELFTGFFGMINGDNASFTVMIRCAKYLGGSYRLFAGAGVNSDSDPDQEAQEILQKFNVMRAAINL